MLCLIYCAYQDGFYLHIPDYPVPETEAPMLAALTPPSERSYYTSLVLKEKGESLKEKKSIGASFVLPPQPLKRWLHST
ncbi:hypothetical protein GBA52_015434 [Prunus armeniaca]|nr:hypothetical protein GBA52_015434 [Prunus armeniaca]